VTKPSTLKSLQAALTSRRFGAVALMSLSSGLPLGLVVSAVPYWLTKSGLDIKTVGVLSLAQTPYAFKFLWAPLMDRFRPRFLVRSRSWILLLQLALAACTFALAWSATQTLDVALVGALTLLIAFASASQDIAIDAYAVEVLEAGEQGAAVGARTALYRTAMFIASSVAVSLGPKFGWGLTLASQAAIFLLLIPVTLWAPEAEVESCPKSLREAVWEPFVGFLQKHRALEIVAFLVLYKLADNLAVALVRPFLAHKGYSALDAGVLFGSVSIVFTVGATFVGSTVTSWLGVGRALWVFGFAQILSNLGYALVAAVDFPKVATPDGMVIGWQGQAALYLAAALDNGASGLGTGAFGVLLMRLTQKRFSATQFALFSSIFAIGRTVAGPIAGVAVDAIGWTSFFLVTLACGLPGLAMLQRFVPWSCREIPQASDDDPPAISRGAALTRAGLMLRALGWVVGGSWFGLVANAFLLALKGMRGGLAFDLFAPLTRYLAPTTTSEYLDIAGSAVFGLVLGLGAAAYLAARRGVLSAKGSASQGTGPVSS